MKDGSGTLHSEIQPSPYDEIPHSDILDYLPRERGIHYETPEDVMARMGRNEVLHQFVLDMKAISRQVLTPNQKKIFDLYLKGKALKEIASTCGVSEPTVHEAMYGKKVRKDGQVITIWGGLFKKLRNALLQDPKYRKRYSEYFSPEVSP